MYKKSVFTLRDSWVWVLLALISSLVTPMAFLHNGVNSWPQLIITCLVNGSFLFFVAQHYYLRVRWVITWNRAYHTTSQTAVLVQCVLPEGVTVDDVYRSVDHEVNRCQVFWSLWKKDDFLSDMEAVRGALTGATVLVVGELPSVPYLGKVLGYTDGLNVVVPLDQRVICDLPALMSLVRHEVSHLCLDALGVDSGPGGEAHHTIFSQTRFC